MKQEEKNPTIISTKKTLKEIKNRKNILIALKSILTSDD